MGGCLSPRSPTSQNLALQSTWTLAVPWPMFAAPPPRIQDDVWCLGDRWFMLLVTSVGTHGSSTKCCSTVLGNQLSGRLDVSTEITTNTQLNSELAEESASSPSRSTRSVESHKCTHTDMPVYTRTHRHNCFPHVNFISYFHQSFSFCWNNFDVAMIKFRQPQTVGSGPLGQVGDPHNLTTNTPSKQPQNH